MGRWIGCKCTCPLFFGFPSHLGHHRASGRATCASQCNSRSHYPFHAQYQQLHMHVYICQSLTFAPLMSIRLLSVSVSLFLLCKYVHRYTSRFLIYAVIYDIVFFFLIYSLCMSLVLLNGIHMYMCMCIYIYTCTYLSQNISPLIVVNWRKDIKSQEKARGRCSKPLGLAGIKKFLDRCYNKWDLHAATWRGAWSTSYICWITKLLIMKELLKGNSTRKDTLWWTELFVGVTVLVGFWNTV